MESQVTHRELEQLYKNISKRRMLKMTEETRLEVIKALAEFESIEDVADFADVTEEEIVNIKNEYTSEIEERRKEMAETWY